MRKIRAKINKFSVEKFCTTCAEDLEAYKYDLVNNKYYNYDLLSKIKKNIYDSLQTPFLENGFIDFNPIKIEKRPENILQESLKTSDDKKSLVPANVINFSVSHKATL
jgi:hypothetical protein